MIFLDVTGSCKSAKNTGIQRMTRRIFLELGKHASVRPICWNTTGNRYHRLDRRELEILEAPFLALPQATARPDLRGEHFLAELHRLVFRKSIRLENELKSDDVLFVPDLYRDARTNQLPKLIARTEARSAAIFYDAASLRLSILSEYGRRHFQNYIASLAAFDLVICISEESHNDLHRLWKQHGTKATQTCVETLPVEFDQALRAEETVGSRKLILCVGSFEPRKNHLTLLRATEKLWKRGVDFELQLIGRSTGYYGSTITSELKRLQKRHRPIRWLRHVNDLTLHRAYRECRFTVYPSLTEGFGLPILESLWHGKPCICGTNGALDEAGRDGGCLFVDQTSADAVAEGISTLLTDRAKYERLRVEAHARIFRSWSDYTDRLLEHLRDPRVRPLLAAQRN
jgi:glycosyltransferase involved in cell wall biosynthesis